MKKITLLAFVLLSTICSKAQNSYTFSASQGTYTDLVNPTSLNNNQFWDWDEFGPVALPFSFSVFNNTFSHFMFSDDDFVLLDSSSLDNMESYTVLKPLVAFIQDRDITENGSLSPISYKTEGTTGSRIFKMEIKNAGLEEEYWENETLNSFLNYQIWLYEGTGKIEYHFGPSSVSNLLYLYGDDDEIYSLFATETPTFFNSVFLTGLNTNPTYTENSDENLEPGTGLSAIPANGQIYTFTGGTLSTENETEISFKLFPIPAENELNVSLTEIADYNYAIFDILGKKVISGEMKNTNAFSIDTSNLTSGSYLIKINNTIKKFIKK